MKTWRVSERVVNREAGVVLNYCFCRVLLFCFSLISFMLLLERGREREFTEHSSFCLFVCLFVFCFSLQLVCFLFLLFLSQ